MRRGGAWRAFGAGAGVLVAASLRVLGMAPPSAPLPTPLAGNDRLVFGSVVAVYRTSASGMSTETRSRSEVRGAGTGARSRVDAL